MGRVRWLSVVFIFIGVVSVADPAKAQSERRYPPPTYLRELWYHVHAADSDAWMRYFRELTVADKKINSGRRRWGEGIEWGQLKIIGIPGQELGEYDTRPGSGTVRREAFGEDISTSLALGYTEAQSRYIPGNSYMRHIREDLSLNRGSVPRDSADYSQVTYVTVRQGHDPEFIQLLQLTLQAIKKLSPTYEMDTWETIYGGGPQYVIRHPVRKWAEWDDHGFLGGRFLMSSDWVEKALGKVEAARWNKLAEASIDNIETYMIRRYPALTSWE